MAQRLGIANDRAACDRSPFRAATQHERAPPVGNPKPDRRFAKSAAICHRHFRTSRQRMQGYAKARQRAEYPVTT